ncbi:MAG: extracellular solute-binding protein [Lachnospiraceae bacterium]|nr:extracellular solute-binding protein [Lachnospiraceae bacterium]
MNTKNVKRMTAMATAAVTLAATACTGFGAGLDTVSAAKTTSGDKEITVWVEKVFSDDANALMEERLKAYQEEAGVTVNYEMVGASDFVTMLNATIEAGSNVPDVVSMDTTKILNYYPNIPALDVSDLVDEINTERPYFEASYEGTKIDGVHYYVPYCSSSVMMFVRKDIMEKNGLEIPTTWDEVYSAAEAVSNPGEDFYGLGMGCGENDDDDENTLRQMIWNAGGYLMDADGGITCEDEKVAGIISKFAELYQAEAIPADATTWDAGGNNSSYLAGRTAIVFNAPTLYNALKADEYKELFENTAVLAPPTGSDNGVYMNYNRGFSIMNTCQDVDTASGLIKYLCDKTWYDEYMGSIAPVFAPLFQDETENPSWTEDEVNAQVLKYAQNASGYYGYPVASIAGRAAAAKHYFTFPVGKAFNQVASGAESVENALENMKYDLEDFMDQVG